MHAYGDGGTRASARFDAGSDLFTAAGKSNGRNTGLFEAGLDFQLTPSAVLGVSYSGQYSSSGAQNGVNANLSIKF
jgi:outer membrane autotransporter protein